MWSVKFKAEICDKTTFQTTVYSYNVTKLTRIACQGVYSFNPSKLTSIVCLGTGSIKVQKVFPSMFVMLSTFA
jgi:hypothetical protein